MVDKPLISDTQVIAQSRIFQIEAVDLLFSNGEQRVYERFKTQGWKNGAVLVVPITADNELILVREYAVGVEAYELNFPKGMIDAGETPEQAALREMQEEAGVTAKRLTWLKSLAVSPGYMQNVIQIFLAQDLSDSCLEGDEPEPLEVVKWPLANYQQLMAEESFSGALSMAALLLAKEKLHGTV